MKNTLRTVVCVCLAGASALLLLLASCSREDSLDRPLRAGVLRVGYAIEAPFSFLGPNGEVTGQSPELAKLVCGKLGIANIEWRLVEFGSLIDELEEERIDVIAAGMFITKDRAKRVAFSEPVFRVLQGLLVARGNPYALHSYQQALAREEVKIAVLSGAVEETLLRRMGATDGRLALAPDAQTGRAAVESGLAHGLALSSITIQWMALRDQLGKTEIATPFEQPDSKLAGAMGYGAFAFRKQDMMLLNAWNKALPEALKNPRYLKMLADFGFTPQEAPGEVSTREVLSR